MLTIHDYVLLFCLISYAAFITYIVHEVGNAVNDWLNDY